MAEYIPLHVYLPDFSRSRSFERTARYAVAKGVSFIWLDIAEAFHVKRLGELSAKLGMKPVAVLHSSFFALAAVEGGASDMALPFSRAEELLCSLKGKIPDSIEVFVTNLEKGVNYEDLEPDRTGKMRGRGESEEDTLGAEVKAFTRAVQELQRGGCKNLFSCFFHPDIVTSFNISRSIHDEFGTKALACLRVHRTVEAGMYETALLAGSLLCEGSCGGILIVPEPSTVSKPHILPARRHLAASIDLSKRVLGVTGHIPLPYTIISCPMCGRCQMNIQRMAVRVERIMRSAEKRYRRHGKRLEDFGGLRVAVMGCNVNGPGEAREADIGVAGGKKRTATIFIKGKPIQTLPEKRVTGELSRHIEELIAQRFALPDN